MIAPQSPLFEPVLWEGASFQILDENRLPNEIKYISVTDVSQALDAVRQMKTRAFGQVLTFLYSGALIARSYKDRNAEPLREHLARMTQQFCDARPTFDFRGLGSFFDQWFKRLPVSAPVGDFIAQQARELGAEIVRGRYARARRVASILPSNACVLTHCNVSGELVTVANHCKEMGNEVAFVATETRPYLQGTRLTAWELAQAGVTVSLIPDCAIAQVMAKGEVNAVVVGSDRAAQNGDVINKVGTYPIALMAKEYGIPFHALVQDPRSVKEGSEVAIEERPASELLTFQGRSLLAGHNGAITARYPAFDVTPAELITHLVGFDDLYTPKSFRHRYQYKPPGSGDKRDPPGKYVLIYGIPTSAQIRYLSNELQAERAESILVPEMRPQLWGAHRVAPALLSRNVPITLISDNMMGTLCARGEIRKLCLFYDTLTERGPDGICGSLLAARLARLHGVPVTLLQGDDHLGLTVDRDVTTFLGIEVCPRGVSIPVVENEIIPWALCKE
jgi:methylthioribose-1-phosphate isomerase